MLNSHFYSLGPYFIFIQVLEDALRSFEGLIGKEKRQQAHFTEDITSLLKRKETLMSQCQADFLSIRTYNAYYAPLYGDCQSSRF